MKASLLLTLLAAAAGSLGLLSCAVPGQPGLGGSVQGTGNVEALERQAPVPDAPDVREGEAARAAAYYSNGGQGYYPGGGYGRYGGARNWNW